LGVGSEIFGAVSNGRRGIGMELKSSYFAQAVKNLEQVSRAVENEDLFAHAISEK
jgi:hypothetical protein